MVEEFAGVSVVGTVLRVEDACADVGTHHLGDVLHLLCDHVVAVLYGGSVLFRSCSLRMSAPR